MISQVIEPIKRVVLVLGTGGTIAGLKTGDVSYDAAQIGVAELLPGANKLDLQAQGIGLQYEQIAQIDSKNMSFAIWEQLYKRLQSAMQDLQIDGVVITHGTDTVEETAFFLHLSLATTKPVVLTGAMRPADAMDSDGPTNLVHAIRLAAGGGIAISVAFAGKILRASHVQKVHPTRLDAFDERITDSESDTWIVAQRAKHPLQPHHSWRKVAIVHNYVGADGSELDALLATGFTGFVVAATGNGTLSEGLQAAVDKALRAGCLVLLTTRCEQGRVLASSDHRFEVLPLTALQARVLLSLRQLSHHLNLHASPHRDLRHAKG